MPYRPTSEQARQQALELLRQGGLTDSEIARRTGLSRATVARLRQQQSAAPPEPSPEAEPPPAEPASPTRPAEAGASELLEELMAALQAASPDERARLRQLLWDPPTLLPSGRVKRRTVALYLPDDLVQAVRDRAQQEGVAPSTVVERVLRAARQAGWL